MPKEFRTKRREKIRKKKLATLSVRVTETQRDYIERLADGMALNVSEWLESACIERIGITNEAWRKL